ncbi:CYTH domain-containing protein [Enterococcus faecalis]|uniref:CYTH domain-containing protein n=1 Tax=Enterococcus faecalis TaxID=1351 RepID=UPI0019F65256|nr:CYTH domain-containing protein [Enterococcus faecalis]EGO8510065.1 CYTH domain-containing protein [Enterococcus faecalis]EGQ7429182.1 CYTH domain-containing protein [Enterococcus faecalis]
MIEKELKIMLSSYQYSELLKYFDNGTSKKHKNYYFDDEVYSLFKADITCRIREKGNSFFLQVKCPLESGSTYVQKEEYTVEINSFSNTLDIFSFSLSNLPLIDCGSLGVKGVLETLRYKKELDNQTIIFLDKNYYLDVVDYELEIEFQNEGRLAMLIRELEKLKLKLRLSDSHKIGKRTRLFNRIFLNESNSL